MRQGSEFHLTASQLAMQFMDVEMDGPYVDVADEKSFLAPGNMVARLNAELKARGFPEETRPAQLACVVFRSLARRYAEVIEGLRRCAGKTIERVCIVGGGVKNEALNRLSALSTGLEVVKGSGESTLIGNVAVQIAALENTRSLEQIQRISSRLSFVGES